jgi:hypothetical protein
MRPYKGCVLAPAQTNRRKGLPCSHAVQSNGNSLDMLPTKGLCVCLCCHCCCSRHQQRCSRLGRFLICWLWTSLLVLVCVAATAAPAQIHWQCTDALAVRMSLSLHRRGQWLGKYASNVSSRKEHSSSVAWHAGAWLMDQTMKGH